MTVRRRVLVGALALAAAGCDRLVRPPAAADPPAAPAAAAAWTPERISRDPVGYLAYADREIVRQIAEREARIAKTEASRRTVGERADKLRRDVRDAAAIRKRLQAATARADEDEAWPVTFAGRKLERARAVALAEASARFVQSRAPLLTEYEQALAKIDGAEQALRSDIAELGRLREKLALDLERVRLNQGIAEVAELRESVAALSGFTASLAEASDNPLETLAEKARPLAAETELESLLGK